MMNKFLNLLLWGASLCAHPLWANVSSPQSQIHFDLSKGDQQYEMSLNPTGLTLSANLNCAGPFHLGVQHVASGSNSIQKSLVMANTTHGNVFLTLPTATSVMGQLVHVKNVSGNNKVLIDSEQGIDNGDRVALPSTNITLNAFVQLVSDGSQWQVLNSSSEVSRPTVSSNLVLHYNFNETSGNTLFDQSDIGLSGETRNGLSGDTNSESGMAPSGNALRFDGVDDWVYIPRTTAAANALDLESDFTICSTVYIPAATDKSVLFNSARNTPQSSGVYVNLKTDAKKLNIVNYLHTGTVSWTSAWNAGLSHGTWLNIAITRTVTASQLSHVLYLNGEQIDSTSVATSFAPIASQNSTFHSLMKGYWANNSNYNACVYDDLKVYNRALRASEIRELYDQMGYLP
jgi:hypothetical protein